MSVKHRSPAMRLTILAAFVLAAGLFALRAYDTFAANKSESVGGPVEQELTYLLEPMIGPDKVRVSVTGLSPKSVLVMIDGDMATDLRPLRTRIETILTAAMAFDPERDSLTISQFPFARGVGASLTIAQMLELSGLGILMLLVLASLITPKPSVPNAQPTLPQPKPFAQTPSMATPPRLTASNDDARPEFQDAATLAETNPNETADLVRDWMSYAED